jgi:hypothetical protein
LNNCNLFQMNNCNPFQSNQVVFANQSFSTGHGCVVLVAFDWAGAAAAAIAMVLGMVGLAVEAEATVEVTATNEGGWTEDGLAGAVLVVVRVLLQPGRRLVQFQLVWA